MSDRPQHVRRLSLFGLGASQPFFPLAGEQTRRPKTSAGPSFPAVEPVKQPVEDGVPSKQQSGVVRRKLSKRRKPTDKTQSRSPSSPPTSYSFSNLHLSELSHESNASYSSQRRPSLQRKTSQSVRNALSSIFVPKPSRKTVTGILDSEKGISGGKASEKRRGPDRKTNCYESRSPSPPSPEIRPPSGLGQIASSVDLSTYAQDEREGSFLVSISDPVSRTPSVVLAFPSPPSDATTLTPHTKSLKLHESDAELFYQPATMPPTAPSQTLIWVLDLVIVGCPHNSLASLARTSREFLHSVRSSLYSNINSDDLGEDEKRRRKLLQTLASNSDIASLVKAFRWVCFPVPASSASSSLSAKRSIPRRAPTVSLSSSPEEYVLPRVLSSVPNLETLNLVQPHSAVLQALLPPRRSPQQSPRASPGPSSPQLPSPILPSLKSLKLSGRTTLSTTFGSVLARFLELHPNIHELSLPDVFCLPNVHSLSRHGSNSSSSSSSPLSIPSHEIIPPVPPLPATYTALRDKELFAPPMLPNVTRLTAPLTLATQLVPGRPLRVVDIELTTSLYEGLRPAEVVRALSEAREFQKKPEPGDAQVVNWRAGRLARRTGIGSIKQTSPISPLPSPCPSDDLRCTSWKAARLARRAGINDAKQRQMEMAVSSLRELRIRCTAKIDGRTIAKMLNAVGAELGGVLETLAIGWSGTEQELNIHLTNTLYRFKTLQRLEIFRSLHEEDEDLDTEGQKKLDDGMEAAITLEQKLVEQWSGMCSELSYVEFPSGRIWRSS